MQIKPTLVALLSASLIDFGAAANCNTSQIIHMDVIGTCDCSPEPKGCSTPCPGCAVSPVPTKNIRNCNGGCEDSESDCAACGIWFHTLCNCLQHPLNCQNSGTIQKYGAPVWVLLETPPGDHNLVTTTQFLPGIRQMDAGHDEAWLFAQQKFDKTSEALAMNPVVVRTMEQVHIHLCPHNTTTATMLGKITSFSSSKLVQLADDKEMYCLGIDHSVDVKGFAGLVADFINNPPPGVCKDMVGAAIMEDDKNRRWACATTNRHGPLAKVCFH